MKIAVSVGHTLSGADTGAAGYLNESKCTREIGELVKSKLETQGHSVIYCRIDNAGSVNESLSYRVNKANAANVDLFIEIHLNAGGGTGAETWICGTGGIAEKYARNIVNSICELGYYNRGVKVGNLYVTRNTNAPAVLIECCFVDSKSDSDRYDAHNMASKIVKGITGKEVSNNMETIECDAIALEGCVVNVNGGKGAIYQGELFKWKYTSGAEDGYKKYVDYYGSDRSVKSGYIESGKVSKIVDAYNYYNAGANKSVYDKSDLSGESTGAVWTNEKFCVLYISDGKAFIAYDNSAGEKLVKTGFIDTKDIYKIGEEPPKEETPIEPTQKNYKVTITCKDKVEAELIKGFLSTAKVEEY